MLNRQLQREIAAALEQRRDRILSERAVVELAQEDPPPDSVSELEELARQEQDEQLLERLDKHSRDELARINRTLIRIGAGQYGGCLECGGDIRTERLRAQPLAERCAACAGKREYEGVAAEQDALEDDPPGSLPGPAEPDREREIMARFERYPRLDAEEVDIACAGNRARLVGSIPSERQREVLHEILEDIMGMERVDDRLKVEQLAWERRDRPGRPRVGFESEDEILLQGEPASEDVHQAVSEGGSVMAPDHLVRDGEQ